MTSESPAPSERVTRQHLGFSNVVYLGIVSLFTDISSEMVLGILPFFVINDLHATKALLGLMEGAAEFTNHIFRVFAGFISDKIARRKPLILAGYALSVISKPFFAAAEGYVDALFVRVTDRIGKGVRTSLRDALISDSVDDGTSGRAFGLHRSLDQMVRSPDQAWRSSLFRSSGHEVYFCSPCFREPLEFQFSCSSLETRLVQDGLPAYS